MNCSSSLARLAFGEDPEYVEAEGEVSPTTTTYSYTNDGPGQSRTPYYPMSPTGYTALDPTIFEQGVREHAKYLGIDPDQDRDYLWIAKESLIAPLPSGWVQVQTTEGNTYYYNEHTQESSWEHPRDKEFIALFQQEKSRAQWHWANHGAYAWSENHGIVDAPEDNMVRPPEWTSSDAANYNSSEITSALSYGGAGDDDQGLLTARTTFTSISSPLLDEKATSAHSSASLIEGCTNGSQVDMKDLVYTAEAESQIGKQRSPPKMRANLDIKGEEMQRELEVEVIELRKTKRSLLREIEELDGELETVKKLEKALTKEKQASGIQHSTGLLELQRRCEELCKKLTTEEIAKDALATECTDLRQKLERAEDQLNQLREYQDQTQILRVQLRKAEKELSVLEGEKLQHQTVREDLKALQILLSETKASLTEHQEQLAVARKENDILRRKLQASTASSSEAHEGIKKLRDEADAELHQLRQRLTETIKEKDALQSALRQMELSQDDLKATHDSEVKERRREFETLAEDLRDQIKRKDLLLKELLENNNDINVHKQRLEQEMQKLRNQVADFPLALLSARAEERQNVRKEFESSLAGAEDKQRELAALLKEEAEKRKVLHNRLVELQGNIRVFCRVRPVQQTELQSTSAAAEVVTFSEYDDQSLSMKPLQGNKGRQSYTFDFDKVFQPTATQTQVFDETKPLVVSALDGYNVCIFAYGQTGSGKTHTMSGSDMDPGVNIRALKLLFTERDQRTRAERADYRLLLSMLEVYNETVFDLLQETKQEVDIRVDKGQPFVEGLTEVEVSAEDEVTKLVKLGLSHRAVGSHNANEHSSRSHLVLTVKIESRVEDSGKAIVGKLHLIDLAGSERVSKTDASGQRLKEAQNINRSLSALGDVIHALGSGSKHIPFRNSKLTFLLQDSLGGNSKVLMFANISPVQWNASESLCTLNFAQRCRSVALGQAKINDCSIEATPSQEQNEVESEDRAVLSSPESTKASSSVKEPPSRGGGSRPPAPRSPQKPRQNVHSSPGRQLLAAGSRR